MAVRIYRVTAPPLLKDRADRRIEETVHLEAADADHGLALARHHAQRKARRHLRSEYVARQQDFAQAHDKPADPREWGAEDFEEFHAQLRRDLRDDTDFDRVLNHKSAILPEATIVDWTDGRPESDDDEAGDGSSAGGDDEEA